MFLHAIFPSMVNVLIRRISSTLSVYSKICGVDCQTVLAKRHLVLDIIVALCNYRAMNNLSQHILKVRESSRRIVRELGLLGNESPFDLPLSFRHVLIELDLRGQLNQLELTELLILDKSTVSRMVKKLTNYKLVAAAIDKSDRRYKLLSINGCGQEGS